MPGINCPYCNKSDFNIYEIGFSTVVFICNNCGKKFLKKGGGQESPTVNTIARPVRPFLFFPVTRKDSFKKEIYDTEKLAGMIKKQINDRLEEMQPDAIKDDNTWNKLVSIHERCGLPHPYLLIKNGDRYSMEMIYSMLMPAMRQLYIDLIQGLSDAEIKKILSLYFHRAIKSS